MTERTFARPEGISTSVTYPELALLQRYAWEAEDVLEIGTHYGFSCIGMALAGAHVTSVDPHYEGAWDNPDTWQPFLRNWRRYGHVIEGDTYARGDCGAGYITAYVDAIEDWAAERLSGFGLVFIDGNHTWPCPRRDIQIAYRYLRKPGYVAIHDVTPNWAGVWRAANEATDPGQDGELVKLEQVGTLAIYQAVTFRP